MLYFVCTMYLYFLYDFHTPYIFEKRLYVLSTQRIYTSCVFLVLNNNDYTAQY